MQNNNFNLDDDNNVNPNFPNNDPNYSNYLIFCNNYINTFNSTVNYLANVNNTINEMQRNIHSQYFMNSRNNFYNNYGYNNVNNDINNDYQNTNYIENNEVNQVNNDDNEEINQNMVDDAMENLSNLEPVRINLNRDFEELSRRNLINLLSENITKLRYGDIENPLNDTCTITHDTFEPDDEVAFIDECGHIFKYDALLNWIIQHQSCPNCRHNFLTGSGLTRYSTDNGTMLYLTGTQFREYLASTIINSMFTRGTNSNNNYMAFTIMNPSRNNE